MYIYIYIYIYIHHSSTKASALGMMVGRRWWRPGEHDTYTCVRYAGLG